ncbi:MAG: hypothetical protein AAFN74_01675 [Myxococcota bacterium]
MPAILRRFTGCIRVPIRGRQSRTEDATNSPKVIGKTTTASLDKRVLQTVLNAEIMTWAELAAAVGEPEQSEALLRATRTRTFTWKAVVATASGQNTRPRGPTLVFRAERLETVAASGRCLRLALSYLRKKSTHLHSVGEVKAAFKSRPLKKAFGASLQRALKTATLPIGVAAVLRRGHFYLLLQDDLLASPLKSTSTPQNAAISQPTRAQTIVSQAIVPKARRTYAVDSRFADAFDRAFNSIDARTGGRNFVKLIELRRALATYPRPSFDEQLNALRRAGRYSLDAAEGTHDRTTSEEREAGIIEAGRRLLYCARR